MKNSLKFEPLDSMLVERGTVKKCLLFQQGYFSVAILILSPGAKIKKHPHRFNNEKYVLDTGEVLVCTKGCEHELENSNGSDLRVIAIQWA